ncbi:hypothetical protein LSH36_14g03088 [Paralvinella palmiformis]|uniref:Guanine nucleotide-binding protein subunit beta-like protein n=1 Tax=Paralvinella palmiformis TaxID=53620 RepID=A0AAD9KCF5_9ANNE|nr:hypothetical protein LSH36_14g03088 [Paralvinella palmiformis]
MGSARESYYRSHKAVPMASQPAVSPSAVDDGGPRDGEMDRTVTEPSVGSSSTPRADDGDRSVDERHPVGGVVEVGWEYVRSSVKPEIATSPFYVIATHSNTRDVMLFHVGEDGARLDRCVLVAKHAKEVTSLAVMSDNVKFVTGGSDNFVYTWTVISDNGGDLTAKCVGEMQLESGVRMLSSHPHHDRIAIVLSGNVVLLRHLSKDEVDEMRIQIKDSNVTALSQGTHTLVYGTDSGLVYVWQYEKPDNLVTFYRATSSHVHFLSMRNDTIASWGMNDDYIRVWDKASEKSTGTLCTGNKHLAHLVLSSDGTHVITTLGTNDVIVYQNKANGFGRLAMDRELCLLAVDNSDLYLVSTTGTIQKRDYRELGSSQIRPGCEERITNTDVIKAEVTNLTLESKKKRKPSAVCGIL